MPSVQDAVVLDYGAVRLPDDPKEREAFLQHRGGDFDVAVTSGKVGVGTDLMRSLPALRAVVNFGVGYDATDISQARERGIAVSNTPEVLNDCVADTALALYLDVLRRISAADRYVRGGQWAIAGNFPLATKASGKRVGILGLGRIGKVIARRLEAFDCTISYHNRRPVAEVPYEYCASPVDLALQSDVLIIAAAGGPDSAKLVGPEVIDALGPSGYLINVARGSVVDEGSGGGAFDRSACRRRPGRLRRRTQGAPRPAGTGQRGTSPPLGQRNTRDPRRDGRADAGEPVAVREDRQPGDAGMLSTRPDAPPASPTYGRRHINRTSQECWENGQ